MSSSVLVIYTGGTIGMLSDPKTGILKPFDFDSLMKKIPELNVLDVDIETFTFGTPIDSSNMTPHIWGDIAQKIKKEYVNYDGFVVLHGSDTMAYTASALSFMLEDLSKPIILTGSQLPIGTVRTDGKENLITAIEIAAAQHKGLPMVPEVAIYFDYQLYRGNRTTKVNAEYFEAFESYNYQKLAKAGVSIHYNDEYIRSYYPKRLSIFTEFNENVAILKLFPGISEKVLESFFNIENLQGVVIETFGNGNALTEEWFCNQIQKASDKGIYMLSVTQCNLGAVKYGKYETSSAFKNAGVISGHDITTEAAITKLMYVLGKYSDEKTITSLLSESLVGEMTVN